MNSLCVFAANCESFDPTVRLPAPVDAGLNLCTGCARACESDVAALVVDYVDLVQRIPRRGGFSDIKIARPKPESMPPIDVAVHALCTDVAVALTAAEADLRRALRLPGRDTRHVREGYNVQVAAEFLAARVDELAGLTLMVAWFAVFADAWRGTDALSALRGLHERARRVAGADMDVAVPGACPACRLHAMVRRSGADTVRCGVCGGRWPWEEFRKYVTLSIVQRDIQGPRSDVPGTCRD